MAALVTALYSAGIIGNHHETKIHPHAEEILFDGRGHVDNVVGKEGTFWRKNDIGGFVPSSQVGRGQLTFEHDEHGGILNVQRKNTAGRFELRFQKYTYSGKEYPMIPKDESISGQRTFRVKFDAKVARVGDRGHVLRTVIKDYPEDKAVFAEHTVSVTSNEWQPFMFTLLVEANQDCELRMYDQIGLETDDDRSVPSSIQIRMIVLSFWRNVE